MRGANAMMTAVIAVTVNFILTEEGVLFFFIKKNGFNESVKTTRSRVL